MDAGAESRVVQRPIARAAWLLISSSLVRRVGWASASSGEMVPRTSRSLAWTKTHGFPQSIHVADIPENVSVTLPVGRSFPVFEPLVNNKSVSERYVDEGGR